MRHQSAARLASRSGVDRNTLVGKQLLQLAGLEHLADDVATADELALDVELRNGRPVRIDLDAVAQVGGLQNVEALVADADVVEDLHHLTGKTALRKLRRALHEKHDVVRLHFAVDEFLDAHLRFLIPASPLRSRLPGRSLTHPCNPTLPLYVTQTVVRPKQNGEELICAIGSAEGPAQVLVKTRSIA